MIRTPCIHAIDLNLPGTVKCSLDLFGGQPHSGVCEQCEMRNKPKEGLAVYLASAPPVTIAPTYTNQPGDILARVIHEMTGETPCGMCNARRQQMNEWGYVGCVREIKTICDWIQEEAQKRGKTLDASTVISAIWAAVKVGLKAEKESLTQGVDGSTDNTSVAPSPAIAQEIKL